MKKSAFTSQGAVSTAVPIYKPNFFFTLAKVFSGPLTSQRKSAFTLAEVLVTLGIIGVVSAMTVPSLMQNYQRQSYVTQLHKFYNELSQVLLQYQTEKNALNLKEAGLNSQQNAKDLIKSHFKIVVDCGEDNSPCFADDYKKMNGTNISLPDIGNAFTLASGQSIKIVYNTENAYGYLIAFQVDINGQKGPNIQGRDLFEIFVYNTDNGNIIDDLQLTGAVTGPLTEEYRETQYETYCKAGAASNRHGCFGKILNDNWQMTY